jgi:hypothetical protein
MFGCLAVYVKDKFSLYFVAKEMKQRMTMVCGWHHYMEHHESLRPDFPNMRSIRVLGKKVTGWQLLPADAPDLGGRAPRCEFIQAGDPRISKVPARGGRQKR